MARMHNGKPIRERGGQKHAHKPLEGGPRASSQSTTALVEASGKYYECYETVESVESHLVPRKSLTQKQHLKLFKREIETEPVVNRQLDKSSPKEYSKSKRMVLYPNDPKKYTMIAGTTERVTWKSDTTLLKGGKPFASMPVLKRQTSGSKRIKLDDDALLPNRPRNDMSEGKVEVEVKDEGPES